MNAVVRERTMLSMQCDRTQHGYRLTVSVPSIADGAMREYVYEYTTLAALRTRCDALMVLWLDSEHVALQDNLEAC